MNIWSGLKQKPLKVCGSLFVPPTIGKVFISPSIFQHRLVQMFNTGQCGCPTLHSDYISKRFPPTSSHFVGTRFTQEQHLQINNSYQYSQFYISSVSKFIIKNYYSHHGCQLLVASQPPQSQRYSYNLIIINVNLYFLLIKHIPFLVPLYIRFYGKILENSAPFPLKITKIAVSDRKFET